MVSGSLTSSINKMKKLLKTMDINNSEAVFPENSAIHEIQELGASFNEMALRIENLVDQLLLSVKKQNELEAREKEAEMIALQAQINPHFLYNTFESINALIQMDEKQKATRMVTSLSDMLRFVADSSNTIVSISEELLYVKTYFEIMQMRFGDKLSFIINADDGILQYKTIKLILQPIIENAIYHGIVPKSQPGEIHVNCSAREDEIIFLIYDNGNGMSEEALGLLNDNLDRKHFNGKIGLYNVQNRLRLFYGERFGLKIESKPGKGTTVEIKIPKVY
jgi:sensor histidine kinase YesM